MRKILAALAAVAALGVVYLISAKRPEPPPARLEPPRLKAAAPSPAPAFTIPVSEPAAERSPAEATASAGGAPPPTSKAVEVNAPPVGSQSNPPVATGKKVKIFQDPLARVALQFVGADPEADAYWLEAINDPALPPSERKDLIEDLNEEGFSDPKHPTLDDLPLIVSRLERIKWLAPYAMDQENFDAFQEAYKDLLNMGYLATGSGWPIQ